MYYNGIGLEQNYQKVFQYFKLSVDQGNELEILIKPFFFHIQWNLPFFFHFGKNLWLGWKPKQDLISNIEHFEIYLNQNDFWKHSASPVFSKAYQFGFEIFLK